MMKELKITKTRKQNKTAQQVYVFAAVH